MRPSLVYRAQIFRDKWNFCAPSIFRDKKKKMTVKKEKYHTMIFFSLIAPKVRHVQTIDKKYTHGQYNQILFLNERFCTLFAWKEQTGYAIQFLNKSSCLSSFQIAQLSAVKCLKKYMVMHVPGNNIPFWNAISFELEPHTILPDERSAKKSG